MVEGGAAVKCPLVNLSWASKKVSVCQPTSPPRRLRVPPGLSPLRPANTSDVLPLLQSLLAGDHWTLCPQLPPHLWHSAGA